MLGVKIKDYINAFLPIWKAREKVMSYSLTFIVRLIITTERWFMLPERKVYRIILFSLWIAVFISSLYFHSHSQYDSSLHFSFVYCFCPQFHQFVERINRIILLVLLLEKQSNCNAMLKHHLLLMWHFSGHSTISL